MERQKDGKTERWKDRKMERQKDEDKVRKTDKRNKKDGERQRGEYDNECRELLLKRKVQYG